MASSNVPSSGGKLLENPLVDAPQSIQWRQTFELGYDEPAAPAPSCFCCSKLEEDTPNKKLSRCAKCQVAVYCSRECQVQDWKQGRHKMACPSYARLASLEETKPGEDQEGNGNDEKTSMIKATIRSEIFSRIRFYACPYAVHKEAELGKGFLFLQSDTTLKDLSIGIPKDRHGRPFMQHDRAILMYYLTMGEFDAEVCRDDFEMAVVRTKLQELVDEVDSEKEVVVLFRLRCGHVALGKAVLVPDYRICKKLGKDYYADNPAGAVQLNIDDL